ncbi:unnamed protein product [Nesidiocoris tenuis]|uniref:Out at first protein BRICHOS-like domain-containing protein n=1 Tax=Nesidiocoris tenuis TaxID=355587 RepID=A0A6H5G7F5_9HEMI|nr:unnamed protein product [Nesidiocoris tenuis]
MFTNDSTPLLQLVLFLVVSVNTQLLINVKNQGGDVLQETITANVTDDTVTLEFQRSDGTLITQLIDFRAEVQILKALVLGEEERGQSQYQVMCFVCHVNKDEFISSDAMSKLRQKNPGTLRTPEIEKEKELYDMNMLVEVSRSAAISRHIASLCAEASDATYTRTVDVESWVTLPEPQQGRFQPKEKIELGSCTRFDGRVSQTHVHPDDEAGADKSQRIAPIDHQHHTELEECLEQKAGEDCRTRGVPYIAPKQLDIDETYRPANRRTPIRNKIQGYNEATRQIVFTGTTNSFLDGDQYLESSFFVQSNQELHLRRAETLADIMKSVFRASLVHVDASTSANIRYRPDLQKNNRQPTSQSSE